MGVMPATDIFQSRIVSIFTDMGPELPIPFTNENKKRLGHIYKVDNLILIIKKPYKLAKVGKIFLPTYSEGIYRILKLYKMAQSRSNADLSRIFNLSAVSCHIARETDNLL
jgi:hypothetical protein